MRWYRDLTPRQQRVLLASVLGVVVMGGLLAWSVWSMQRCPMKLMSYRLMDFRHFRRAVGRGQQHAWGMLTS